MLSRQRTTTRSFAPSYGRSRDKRRHRSSSRSFPATAFPVTVKCVCFFCRQLFRLDVSLLLWLLSVFTCCFEREAAPWPESSCNYPFHHGSNSNVASLTRLSHDETTSEAQTDKQTDKRTIGRIITNRRTHTHTCAQNPPTLKQQALNHERSRTAAP